MTEDQAQEVIKLLTHCRDLLAFLVELEAGPDPDEADAFPPDMPLSS